MKERQSERERERERERETLTERETGDDTIIGYDIKHKSNKSHIVNCSYIKKKESRKLHGI